MPSGGSGTASVPSAFPKKVYAIPCRKSSADGGTCPPPGGAETAGGTWCSAGPARSQSIDDVAGLFAAQDALDVAPDAVIGSVEGVDRIAAAKDRRRTKACS